MRVAPAALVGPSSASNNGRWIFGDIINVVSCSAINKALTTLNVIKTTRPTNALEPNTGITLNLHTQSESSVLLENLFLERAKNFKWHKINSLIFV